GKADVEIPVSLEAGGSSATLDFLANPETDRNPKRRAEMVLIANLVELVVVAKIIGDQPARLHAPVNHAKVVAGADIEQIGADLIAIAVDIVAGKPGEHDPLLWRVEGVAILAGKHKPRWALAQGPFCSRLGGHGQVVLANRARYPIRSQRIR